MVVQRDGSADVMRVRRAGRTWLISPTRGPLTPDHVIRTKPVPLVGRDVDAFAAAYSSVRRRASRRALAPSSPISIRRRGWCSIPSSAC